MGQRLGRLARDVEQLARWWTSASQEERFNVFKLSIEGAEGAPPLEEIRLAIYLAETEAGEVSEG